MKQFFDSVRASFGALSQSQVDGFNALLLASVGMPIKHRAYILATAWHETAFTMQPIHERGQVSYFDKYEPGTKIGKDLGNTLKGDGYRFRGRGYVQLTGRRNYAKAGAALHIDLVGNPDKALEPATAAKIIVFGMSEGWFTAKKLGSQSYVEMRRIVNGVDKAEQIAGYAVKFEAALASVTEAPQEPAKPETPPVTQNGAGKGIAAAVMAIAAAVAAVVAYFWEKLT